MNDAFQIRNNTHYNLRYALPFLTEPIHSVFNGSESVLYLGPKIWEQIPNDVNMINSLVRFKKRNHKVKISKFPQ